MNIHRGLALDEGKMVGYLRGKEGEGRPSAEQRLVERESEGFAGAEREEEAGNIERRAEA